MTAEIADPDRRLALLYVPLAVRPGIAALFALDERLGRIVAGTREPMLAAIRLAWWREAVERLRRERTPDEPLLQALADAVVAHGVDGTVLARIVEGREALPQDAGVEAHGGRGAALFEAAAMLLGGESDAAVANAGAAWALVDLAFHDSVRSRAEEVLAAARSLRGPARWPRRLRPLGMLAALARDDAAKGLDVARVPGSAPRAARMIAHRLFGR